MSGASKVGIKALKITGWVLASLLVLVVAVLLSIRIPAVQNFIVKKVTAFVADKTGTTVSIGTIYIGFPSTVIVNDIFLDDLNNDTLLHAKEVRAGLEIYGLIRGSISLGAVSLNTVTANISRNNVDSTFNFDFLINAFAPENAPPATADTIPAPLDLSVEEISMSNISFRFRDDVTGMHVQSHIGNAVIPVNDLNVDSLRFDAGNIVVNNSSVSIVISKLVTDTAAIPMAVFPEISANKLSLSGVNFLMENTIDESHMNIKSGNFEMTDAQFSLKTNSFKAGKVQLDKASFLMLNKQTAKNSKQATAKESTPTNITIPFIIDVKNLEVTESVFAMKERNAASGSDFDPKNMIFSINTIRLKNMYHEKGTAQLTILQTSVTERSGMALKNLKGTFKTTPVSSSIDGLELATANSNIKGNLNARYESLQKLIDDPGKADLEIHLVNSILSVKDVVEFNSELLKQDIIRNNRGRNVVVNLNAAGTLDNLNISSMKLVTANSTSIAITGIVKGLPDADKLFMNIKARQITTTAADIRSFLTVPETFSIPENMSMSGNFIGSLNTFKYDLVAGTNRGTVIGNGSLSDLSSQFPRYTFTATLKQVDMKYILKNEMYGNVNLKADIKGKGFDPETMSTVFDLKSDNIGINNYEYTNIEFAGAVADGVLSAAGFVADKNLDVELDASLGLIKQKEFYKATIKLKGVDLEALKFSDHPLRASGTGSIDVQGNQVNKLKGNITIKDVLIVKKGKDYPIETLAIININDKKSVSVESSLLTAQFDGSISIDETASQLTKFFNNYFSSNPQSLVLSDSSNQSFSFLIIVKNAPVISEVFVPGLDSFIPGPINGSFNSAESKLNVLIQLPQLIYNGIRIDSLNLRVDSDKESLNMLASLNSLSMGDIKLARTDFIASASDNKIKAGVVIADGDNVKLKMKALITIGSNVERYKFAILDNGITLNDEQWVVPGDNFVELGGSIPVFHNFSLTNKNQSILIDRPITQSVEGIGVKFSNFRIGILSAIIERDTSFLDGILNGQLDLIKEPEGQGIVATVTLDQFSFKGVQVGDFVLDAKSQGKAKYVIALKMSGNGNDLVADGYYVADSTGGKIKAAIDINKLSLKSIEPFTNGQITRSKGSVNGKFNVEGSASLPEVEGEINFADAGFNVFYLNNYFLLKNENLKIDQDGIYFKAFTITDTLNQTAVLNGRIELNDISNPEYFIDLKTDKFLAMNTQRENNDLFFGTLKISSNIKVRGDQRLPVITSNVKLLEGSSFTFIVPENTQLTERGEQDVNFTDPYNRINAIMKRETAADTFKAEITGFDITSNIEITKETTLRILVDQESGDSLVIRGDATMSFSIDPSGKTSLTGGFEISEGSYRVSLQNLVKKNFVITKGSSINWRGDILDAEINIDAVNVVNAVPLELVADQIAGLTEQEINTYRQRLPFQVILHMKGELMKPEISFEISLRPEDQGVLNGTVYAKLTLLNQDPSELNKQVFALLVLNRFVQENPLDNSSGGGLAYVARNSVSKFLSQQLNIFAEQFIKGVELNFDVQSYEEYTTGAVEGRTEVIIGAKKRLMNNRLIVQVSGNVDVEGERTKQNDVSNLAGDIVLEYLLTVDGRYRLRVFRKDQYAGVLDGEVKEAGMGLLYTRDFDTWDQLFSKPKQEIEIKQL